MRKTESVTWKDILQKKLKEEEEKKKELILVETKDAGDDCRCGTCNNNFQIEVYYSPSGKFRQKIVCKHCDIEVWSKESVTHR